MIEPFSLIPPPDDTPPAAPEFPAPLKESGAKALAGLAQAARTNLTQCLARIAHHYPQPATDVTGRGFLVLGTGNVPISGFPASIEPAAPFSISVFTDPAGNERWLPAPSSAMAYDGEFWFAPFQPTLDGTPISVLTPETAPALPPGGIGGFLKFQWDLSDSPLVPDEPIYAARVLAVQLVLADYGAGAPDDDIKAGITYRPWFQIGPSIDGDRSVSYQTLGYCHFWLYLRVLGETPSSSSSDIGSSSSSADSPPPAHQACFGVRMGEKLVYPTWGMLLRPTPVLRQTLVVSLTPGASRVAHTLPEEWMGCIAPGTTRVINSYVTEHTDEPVFVIIKGNEVVATCSRPLRLRRRRLILQLEGLMAGHDGEHHQTDAAGREHNQRFWNGNLS
jgi:hypothetical protein